MRVSFSPKAAEGIFAILEGTVSLVISLLKKLYSPIPVSASNVLGSTNSPEILHFAKALSPIVLMLLPNSTWLILSLPANAAFPIDVILLDNLMLILTFDDKSSA